MTTGAVHNRLAIYLPTLVGGGAERVLINLASGFASQDWPVDFVLAQTEGSFVSMLPGSVRLINLNPVHLKFGRSIYSIPALVRYLRHERPLALLTGLHTNIIAIWARWLSGIPLRLVISEHNTFSIQNQILPFGIRQLMVWLVKKFYPMADKIIAVSEGAADDLAISTKIPRDRIHVVNNPVITPELKAKAKEPLHHPWFAPGEPPVILSIGRLSPQKDYPTLIKAVAIVRELTPVRLLILGEGPDRDMLITLIDQLGMQHDVSLPGFIPNPYPYICKSAMFVLSSRWEGLPTVLVEALYCGSPLIAMDCPSGPREILQNGKYGKLVPVGDVNCLAEAIKATLAGDVLHPPPESWHPYELDIVVKQYLKIMVGLDDT